MDLAHDTENFRQGLKLWRINMMLAHGLRHQQVEQKGEYTFKSASAAYLSQIEFLHLLLFRQPLENWLRWLYKFKLDELGSVIVNGSDQVVGYDLFMFNDGEFRQHILHELYVGVSQELQGQGLSTRLRTFSAGMYDYGKLSAISTVAFDNDIKSLRSAQKAGFHISKRSVRPPGYYMELKLVRRLDFNE